LEKEAFGAKEFAEYAKKNLVLVEVDFPHKKTQTEALKKANKQLSEKYGIDGFPTLVILSSEGKKLGEEVGYGGGGAKKVIAKIEAIRAK
jgi:protein disulfide-isomerase